MTPQSNFTPLPERISRLGELAYDLSWSWHREARAVFRRLDYPLWRLTAHNPVRMLRLIATERLEHTARDPAWLELFDTAIEHLDAAKSASGTWWAQHFPDVEKTTIAYFSAEFAIHQSLPIYAGGLGVLAGDHCKMASDLGLPLVGVGFMYPQGYFHQTVNSDGWQIEKYEQIDWYDAPVQKAELPGGNPCVVTVPLADRQLAVDTWCVRLGRVTLYLMDTNREENQPWDRELSARLYGGDREMRLRQEIILGVGGVRVLRALGYEPRVWHLNEGHAAFVIFERLREAIERGETFPQALEEVRNSTVFTTHTPVAAGHDAFQFHLVEKHLAALWRDHGTFREAFLKLAHHDNGGGSQFNMTALAMRGAGAVNAVSKMHQKVTQEMWKPLVEEFPEGRESIRAVTNGVHLPTWISPEIAGLFDRHLGKGWRRRIEKPGTFDEILSIPDEDLWEVRQSLRSYLVAFIRELARMRWTKQEVNPAQVVVAGTLLDHNALTIGFARRFTGYKRPELIFQDTDRLARILTDLRRPVQIVFAGKAHPADDVGKRHLQRVYHRAYDPKLGGRVAFVDDYDMHVAHYLVQGCDVWLNTPRKPLEASGTSGMKASINGVLHCSVGDGWWAEGYTGANGWLIDGGQQANDEGQDYHDAQSLYRLLEEEIVPAFYERDAHGMPQRWVKLIKESIRTISSMFSAARMLKQYSLQMYVPLARGNAKQVALDVGK
jgi:glycogen phosphorylase